MNINYDYGLLGFVIILVAWSSGLNAASYEEIMRQMQQSHEQHMQYMNNMMEQSRQRERSYQQQSSQQFNRMMQQYNRQMQQYWEGQRSPGRVGAMNRTNPYVNSLPRPQPYSGFAPDFGGAVGNAVQQGISPSAPAAPPSDPQGLTIMGIEAPSTADSYIRNPSLR